MLFPAVASVICKTADKKEEQLMDVCAKAVCFIDISFLNECVVVSLVCVCVLLLLLLLLFGGSGVLLVVKLPCASKNSN